MGGRRDSRSPPRRGGRGRDSRSPPRRRPPPRRDSRDNRRGGSKRRDSRSPPRRRSRSRGGRDTSYRIPPPKNRTTASSSQPVAPIITPEQRANSIECNGFLYATMDFKPPNTVCEHSAEVPRSYDGKRCTDDAVLQWYNLPPGWKQVPGDVDDDVKQKVMKPYEWGTHLLVVEDGKAYRTAGSNKGNDAGCLQMIWEMEKGPGRLKLQRLGGSQSFWYGKILIRAPLS
eukprot:gb/GFBE01069476.1/.p1 GENE.gb/GFBE01069476.1/~~gb/GFBE01069476.1/.p1  ORF type:complete len:229 (+),score=19.38 gb/GFBE01069476.1/:1-687(+)